MMSGPAIPVLGDLVRYTIGPILSWAILPGLFRKLFAPRAVPHDFKTRFPASLTLRPKQLRAAAEESALLIPVAAQFQSHYPSIRCPFFHGAGDQIIEAEQARHLHRALPDSVLHLVEEAGHMVTYADGAAIAQAVDTVAGAAASGGLNIKQSPRPVQRPPQDEKGRGDESNAPRRSR
jgi:pimeloyl-ACP methyl ester carboxylesterase